MSVENGADKVGAKRILTEYNEAAAVALALESMPPIKTVGDCWREYRAGAWREIDYHRFRPWCSPRWRIQSLAKSIAAKCSGTSKAKSRFSNLTLEASTCSTGRPC